MTLAMMNADQPPLEFETVAKLDAHLRENRPLTACVFQGLDLRLHTAALTAAYHQVDEAILAGYDAVLFVAAGAGPSAAATVYRLAPTA